MEVRIKKVHPTWVDQSNKPIFEVGEKVTLKGDQVIKDDGRIYRGNDLTKTFSNRCSYFDIFEKI